MVIQNLSYKNSWYAAYKVLNAQSSASIVNHNHHHRHRGPGTELRSSLSFPITTLCRSSFSYEYIIVHAEREGVFYNKRNTKLSFACTEFVYLVQTEIALCPRRLALHYSVLYTAVSLRLPLLCVQLQTFTVGIRLFIPWVFSLWNSSLKLFVHIMNLA